MRNVWCHDVDVAHVKYSNLSLEKIESDVFLIFLWRLQTYKSHFLLNRVQECSTLGREKNDEKKIFLYHKIKQHEHQMKILLSLSHYVSHCTQYETHEKFISKLTGARSSASIIYFMFSPSEQRRKQHFSSLSHFFYFVSPLLYGQHFITLLDYWLHNF